MNKLDNGLTVTYFSEAEFAATGCSSKDCASESITRLDLARHLAGVPFHINSAYRSREHDLKRGRSGNSAHTRGRAFDIRCCNNENRYRIISAAIDAGFTRIGVYPTFVHMDDDPSLPSPRIWYGK